MRFGFQNLEIYFRTYEKFFGLMGQRFCQVNKLYQEPFMKIFVDTYNTVHRLETGKLR